MIKHCELTPVQFIRSLFEDTVDGKVTIEYQPHPLEESFTQTYDITWTAEDVERTVQKYEALVAALEKLGRLHDELEEETKRNDLLTPEEREVWETYIRPFEAFEVDESVVQELYYRAEFDGLDDEENELLARHYAWRREQSIRRLPILCRPPADLITRARRYEHLVSLNAPRAVVSMEGCFLAEELVLYHYSPLVEVLE